jgi:predicted amidohydrolase
MVDAGSSGWHNFEDFKQRVIDRARTRVFAFVNIVGQGMGGGPVEQDVNDMNPQRTAEMVKSIRMLLSASRQPTTLAPTRPRSIEHSRRDGSPMCR